MHAKIFISWWMMGECTGYHVQKEWNFYLAVQARNKFFTVRTIGKSEKVNRGWKIFGDFGTIKNLFLGVCAR